MGLAPAVERSLLRIVAHADSARFVDNLTADRYCVRPPVRRLSGANLSAHSLDQRAECLVHVVNLLDLVFAPAEMKAQYRDAPLIDGTGIDVAIGVCVRDHFTAPR